jgi:hypothetical protein
MPVWDTPGTECARIAVKAHKAPDVPAQQVDQSAVSAGEGNLIVEIEVMPFAV